MFTKSVSDVRCLSTPIWRLGILMNGTALLSILVVEIIKIFLMWVIQFPLYESCYFPCITSNMLSILVVSITINIINIIFPSSLSSSSLSWSSPSPALESHCGAPAPPDRNTPPPRQLWQCGTRPRCSANLIIIIIMMVVIMIIHHGHHDHSSWQSSQAWSA